MVRHRRRRQRPAHAGMDQGPLRPGTWALLAWMLLGVGWVAAESGQEAVPVATAIEAWLALPVADRPPGAGVLRQRLTRDEAVRIRLRLAEDAVQRLARDREAEVGRKSIQLGDKTLRWLERTFGQAPAEGRSLWLSLHGGGNAPGALNDGQWQNQARLYEPAEGVYVAPRAPTDTWNLWHEAHIDPLFERLIEDLVALRGVDPGKVYLMGYSAGGDGVWQLAPRMADRFAAAAMMAGHPNQASLLGLRNLPFAIFVGADDAAYGRNRIAAERSAELDRLSLADPGGYIHLSRIYPGLSHWMERKDAEALPWMAPYRRRTWPSTVVWLQDQVIHRRFYWLRIPDGAAVKAGARITARVEGNTVRLEGDVPGRTELRLADELVDLDREVTVQVNGRQVHAGPVPRQAEAIRRCLEERADAAAAATAILILPE